MAIQDIAGLAANELRNPTGEHRVIREVGSQDLTMPELTAIISREIGQPAAHRFVNRTRKDVEAEFLRRFGTPERWLDDSQTVDAINDGIVRFHGYRPPPPTTMEPFIREIWSPSYLLTAANDTEPKTFLTWSARA